MDRYFIRDILIFLTYAGAVWWGIQIERWTHELGHAITSPNSLCDSYVASAREATSSAGDL